MLSTYKVSISTTRTVRAQNGVEARHELFYGVLSDLLSVIRHGFEVPPDVELTFSVELDEDEV